MSAAATSRPRASVRAERLALAAGVVAAGALALVALALDLGDVAVAVRARAAEVAAGRVERARAAWDERLLGAAPPAPALGLRATVPEAASFVAVGAPRTSRTRDAALETLLDAARAAAAEGDVARALLVLDEALTAAPETAARRPEALLAGLGWAARLDVREVVARYRRELARVSPEETLDGTSVAVLAALVGPPDAAALERAVAALGGARVPLPTPADAVRLEPGAGLVFQPDPHWSALHSALAARTPERAWDAAFRVAERAALAVGAWWPDEPRGDGRWTVSRRGEVLVVQRGTSAGREIFVSSPEQLAAALAPPAGGAGARIVFVASPEERARLQQDPTRAAQLEPLGDTGLTLAVLDPGLPASIRAEERRVLAVRGGLLLLAALVLATSLLSWRALRRGRRLTELRSTFVASVSHDLRTPLASMLLLVENLEQGRVAGESAQARYHRALRQEGERLKRMVEDLLDASRIERGAGPRLARGEVDAAAFLDALEHDLAARALQAGTSATVTRGACPATLHLDADAARRAIWNLFDNALRHGRPDGAPGAVRVSLEATDGVLAVEVEDDGPGIPWRYRETVFEPFERLADRGARRGLMDDTGTGLGLSIVRAIARAHGGDVELLEPRSEHGARLRLTLRIDGEDAA